MIRTEIVLRIPGRPAPKGSMKCVGQRGKTKHQLIEDERIGQKPWRDLITTTARTKVTQRADPYQPIGVEVVFTIDRGPSHFGGGRNARKLKHDAPRFPTKQNTNDVDKMLRLVLDALQDAGVLADDAQVVSALTAKVYPIPRDRKEAFSGPKPPPWAEGYCPELDALPHPGAVIRIFPIDRASLDQETPDV